MTETRSDPMTLMLVEDEGLVALDLRRRLEDLGYSVVWHARDAEAAVQGVRAARPDLVLMDVNLGRGPDGIEAADQIAKEFDLPVVFLTAHSDAATLARAAQVGPFGYVLKPVRDRDLQVAIEIAHYKHQTESRLRRLVGELQDALAHVKTLTGLLPICMHCKKIRNDQGYWTAVETYITGQTGVLFSHGICEGCRKEHYPRGLE